MKKKTEVEAFLFDGTLRKDGKWLVPEWVLSAMKAGTIFIHWVNPSNGMCVKMDSEEDIEYPDNISTYSLFINIDSENIIEVDAVSKKYILYDYYGKISVCDKDDFNKNYVELEKETKLKRVDILPKFYKDDLFRLKGDWIYVPPEFRSPYSLIRCSNCGLGKKIRSSNTTPFNDIIAPLHFCQNCGAEMQNSNLPKREE